MILYGMYDFSSLQTLLGQICGLSALFTYNDKLWPFKIPAVYL